MEYNEDFSAIILAAGMSSRMGYPKQLLEVDGRSMIDHAIAAALEADIPAHVVVGAYKEQILASSILIDQCKVFENRHFSDGMASSLCCGVKHAITPRTGYVFLLADQPGITGSLVRAMATRFRKEHADILYPVFENKRGNPVFIAAWLKKRLLTASGDRGARFLFSDTSLKIVRYRATDNAVVTDIDTEDEYIALTGRPF